MLPEDLIGRRRMFSPIPLGPMVIPLPEGVDMFDLIGAYLPMAFLGGTLGAGKKPQFGDQGSGTPSAES